MSAEELPPEDDEAFDTRHLVLGDLINRVLDKGVVISGHVMISVADVDLLMVDLRLLLTSVQTALERTAPAPPAHEREHGDSPLLPPDAGRA